MLQGFCTTSNAVGHSARKPVGQQAVFASQVLYFAELRKLALPTVRYGKERNFTADAAPQITAEYWTGNYQCPATLRAAQQTEQKYYQHIAVGNAGTAEDVRGPSI